MMWTSSAAYLWCWLHQLALRWTSSAISDVDFISCISLWLTSLASSEVDFIHYFWCELHQLHIWGWLHPLFMMWTSSAAYLWGWLHQLSLWLVYPAGTDAGSTSQFLRLDFSAPFEAAQLVVEAWYKTLASLKTCLAKIFIETGMPTAVFCVDPSSYCSFETDQPNKCVKSCMPNYFFGWSAQLVLLNLLAQLVFEAKFRGQPAHLVFEYWLACQGSTVLYFLACPAFFRWPAKPCSFD